MRLVCSLAVVSVIASIPLVRAARAPEPAAQDSPEPRAVPAMRAFPVRPVVFERNDGQTHASVRFVGRSPGCRLFVRDADAVVSLGDGRRHVRMAYEGASRAAPEGDAPLPGVANHCIGRDPAKWRLGVPTFARVRQRNVWPGVDVEWYGAAQRLECDFVVAPDADHRAVALRFDGGGAPEPQTDGSLVVPVGDARLRLRPPVVFERDDDARRPLDGRYVVRDDGAVAFHVAGRTPGLPLVIDPIVEYASYVGGAGEDRVTSVCTSRDKEDHDEPDGHVWVAGVTASDDFPLFPSRDADVAGATDAFVERIDVATGLPDFSTYLGGAGDDRIAGVDAAERSTYEGVHVAGSTTSDDLPLVLETQAQRGGGVDAWYAFVDNAGVLRRSTYFGGTGDDEATCVSDGAQAVNRATIGGWTTSSDLPSTGGRGTSHAGGRDGFVARMPVIPGQVAAWWVGGTGDDAVLSVDSNEVYDQIAGWTESSDLPVTAGAAQRTRGGGRDGFYGRTVQGSQSPFLWLSYLGGSGDDEARGIAAYRDASGNSHGTFVVGVTRSDDFPVLNAAQPDRKQGSDGFVVGLQFAEAPFFSTYLGGTGDDSLDSVSYGTWVPGAAQLGLFHAAGTTTSHDLPVLDAPQPDFGGGGTDAWVASFDTLDGKLRLCTYLGGSGEDAATSVRSQTDDDPSVPDPIHVGGTTTSGDFPVVQAGQPLRPGPLDGFAARLTGVGAPTAPPGPADPQPTMLVSVRRGALIDGAASAADSASVRASFRWLPTSDRRLEPRTDDLLLEIGNPDRPLTLAVPAGDGGWRVRGRTMRFRGDVAGAGAVDLRIARPRGRRAGRIALVAQGADFPGVLRNPILLRLEFGNDRADHTSSWYERSPSAEFRLR